MCMCWSETKYSIPRTPFWPRVFFRSQAIKEEWGGIGEVEDVDDAESYCNTIEHGVR
jgi:hypothetical protein